MNVTSQNYELPDCLEILIMVKELPDHKALIMESSIFETGIAIFHDMRARN